MKEKIVVGINSLNTAQFPAYTNHMQLMFKLGRKYKDQWDIVLCNPPRMSIDRMRNMAAEVALQCDAKYLVFIDDDVIVPFDFLDRFLAAVDSGNDIVCGNVQIRGYPFDYMMFRWDEKREGLYTLKSVPKDEIISVDAVGFSCVIIKVDILRELTKPFFITTANMTEDVWFCLKVQTEFPETKMACDTGLVCGHILWPEIISEDNREAYTKYYETMFPQETKKDAEVDESKFRGKNYLKELKESIEMEINEGITV